MGHIVEVPQPYNFDEIVAVKGAGYKPDFRILTAGIESDSVNSNLVHMVGSSTIEDLQGDTMSIYALNSMTKAAPNMTVWLNHSYDLPDSMFGSIERTPSILHQAGIADLHLYSDVEIANPLAVKVKRYIDNGRRLGCSIGCMVTKYEVKEAKEETGNDAWTMPSIVIHDVYVVEYSIVGIPANQRSWVENSIRGVFQRTLDPALAPAMKGLWPAQYRDTMKAANGVISKAHFKQLEETPTRARPETRLDWMTDSKQFVVTHKGMQKTVERSDVAALMNGRVELTHVSDALVMHDIDVEEVKSGIPNEIDFNEPTNEGEPDHDNGPYDAEHFVKLHTDALNHDAWNGQHTHTHDAFGYQGEATHSHLHTHLHDNNHNHNNDIAFENEGEKAMDPNKKASDANVRALNKDGSEGLLLKDMTGNHEPYKGIHTHHHDSFGHGDVDAHVHEHFHGDDNDHQHDHKNVPTGEHADSMWSAEPEKVTTETVEVTKEVEPVKAVELDPARLQFLASYNAFGKTLGLPEVTPTMLEKGVHPAAVQEVKTLDDTVLAQLQTVFADALAKALHGTTTPETPPADTVPQEALTVINSLSGNLALFAKSFEHTEGLATRKDAEDATALVVAMKKQLGTLTTDIEKATVTLANIKNMPLGNPLHLMRSTHAEDNLASHADMANITNGTQATAPIAIDSLSQAFSLTEVKSAEYGNGQVMTHRYWPDGVGGSVAKGIRPSLNAKQIQFMGWEDIVAYREGREAKVPYLDNQVV
ncbi:MAG: hypothetical protein NVS4B1_33330 [Ktedonobacteraceae bacterium]